MSLFLPDRDGEELLAEIMPQVDAAAKELGMMVVGGHTETTPGLDRPIVGTTAIGVAALSKIVATRGARAGDYLILTKAAGIEGTAILCTDFASELEKRGVPRAVIERGARFVERVSVVKEALALAERGLTTAMHDPTEGGVLGGAAELAYASGTTVELWADKVPVLEETKLAAKAVGLDVLRLISSGALLAAVPPDKVDQALQAVKLAGAEAAVVGRVKERSGCLVELVRSGKIERVEDVHVVDELFLLWERVHGA
jgi:hydrogenase maturation factor